MSTFLRIGHASPHHVRAAGVGIVSQKSNDDPPTVLLLLLLRDCKDSVQTDFTLAWASYRPVHIAGTESLPPSR